MAGVKAPRWISHRGYCKHEIENTQGAFDEAVNLGFDRLETDLRVSNDGHIVLSHDENLSRTGGPNKNVHDLSKFELQKVELKYYKKLVFFDEFVDRYCAKDWIFDIKPEHGPKTIAALKSWAEHNEAHQTLTKQAWFLVWDREHETLIREFLPEAQILADEKRCMRAGLSLYFCMGFLGAFIKGMIYALPCKKWGRTFFKRSIVKSIHKRGAKALAYLPQNEEEAKLAVKAGYDYILTDFPPVRPRKVYSNDRRPFDKNRSGGKPSYQDRGRPRQGDRKFHDKDRRPRSNNDRGNYQNKRKPYDKNRKHTPRSR